MFCSKSKNFKFWIFFKNFPENIPPATQNTILKFMPKIFCSKIRKKSNIGLLFETKSTPFVVLATKNFILRTLAGILSFNFRKKPNFWIFFGVEEFAKNVVLNTKTSLFRRAVKVFQLRNSKNHILEILKKVHSKCSGRFEISIGNTS